MHIVRCLTGTILLTILLTACGVSVFNGSRIGNDRELLLDYKSFNTTDSQELTAETGNQLHIELAIDSGELSVLIQKGEEEPLYQVNGLTESCDFSIDIEESGTYTVTVAGAKARGSAHFEVVSSEA